VAENGGARARQRVAKFLGLTFPCNKYPRFV
jgi:hypothetical protein